VNLETADSGAIYTGGRDWISSRGSRVCYNYFHDSLGYGQVKRQMGSPALAWGIYLDDNAGGVDNHREHRRPRGPGLDPLAHGRDNLIEINIFVGGHLQQVEYTGWLGTPGSWGGGTLPTMIKGYEWWPGNRLGARCATWTSIQQGRAPSGMIMSGNVLRRNILYYHNTKSNLYKFSNVPLDHNELTTTGLPFGQPLRIEYSTPGLSKQRETPTSRWPKWWQAMGQDQHSVWPTRCLSIRIRMITGCVPNRPR